MYTIEEKKKNIKVIMVLKSLELPSVRANNLQNSNLNV